LQILYTQFNDYSRIFKAVWEILDNYEDTDKRDVIYNKLLSMSYSINSILAEGKKLEEIGDDEDEEITIPVFEMNVDERFEIR
ncbi:MAG: hypothetical protein SPF17_09640, partial [Candidatus Mucispirillum faecigallinarum]|nr:hypothetical protein [Candidatus Mucispirillum faecigallinarum]